jgi:hypothetical protein
MTMTNETLTGTVINGTFRPQDLIPALLDALNAVHPPAYDRITGCGGMVPQYVWEDGDECEWWQSEECQYALESLFDALDACAPDGHYFGAHPGNGSDFGFWGV